jgi:hypothetical protein
MSPVCGSLHPAQWEFGFVCVMLSSSVIRADRGYPLYDSRQSLEQNSLLSSKERPPSDSMRKWYSQGRPPAVRRTPPHHAHPSARDLVRSTRVECNSTRAKQSLVCSMTKYPPSPTNLQSPQMRVTRMSFEGIRYHRYHGGGTRRGQRSASTSQSVLQPPFQSVLIYLLRPCHSF